MPGGGFIRAGQAQSTDASTRRVALWTAWQQTLTSRKAPGPGEATGCHQSPLVRPGAGAEKATTQTWLLGCIVSGPWRGKTNTLGWTITVSSSQALALLTVPWNTRTQRHLKLCPRCHCGGWAEAETVHVIYTCVHRHGHVYIRRRPGLALPGWGLALDVSQQPYNLWAELGRGRGWEKWHHIVPFVPGHGSANTTYRATVCHIFTLESRQKTWRFQGQQAQDWTQRCCTLGHA